jgi:hypothetical protein
MMSEPLPSVRIYFCLQGQSFDPEEVTRRLGIKPTASFRPGDPITKDGQGHRLGYGWMLKVGEHETIEIDDLLRELQETLSGPTTFIKELCDDLGLKPVVICGVGQHESATTTPTLFFPADFVNWLAEIEASLDVDVIL